MHDMTGQYVNDAAIEFTLTDLGGTPIDGENWPVALDYTLASDGDYLGLVADTVVLVAGEKYIALLTEVSGSIKSLYKETVQAEDRRWDD